MTLRISRWTTLSEGRLLVGGRDRTPTTRVIVYSTQHADDLQSTYVISREALNELALGKADPQTLYNEKKIDVKTGSINTLQTLYDNLDTLIGNWPMALP